MSLLYSTELYTLPQRRSESSYMLIQNMYITFNYLWWGHYPCIVQIENFMEIMYTDKHKDIGIPKKLHIIIKDPTISKYGAFTSTGMFKTQSCFSVAQLKTWHNKHWIVTSTEILGFSTSFLGEQALQCLIFPLVGNALIASLQVCSTEWLQHLVFHGQSHRLLCSGHKQEGWGLINYSLNIIWVIIALNDLGKHWQWSDLQGGRRASLSTSGPSAHIVTGGHLVTFVHIANTDIVVFFNDQMFHDIARLSLKFPSARGAWMLVST
jgi:hypothetical protein